MKYNEYFKEAFKYINMVTDPYQRAKLLLNATEISYMINNNLTPTVAIEIGEDEVKKENTSSSKEEPAKITLDNFEEMNDIKSPFEDKKTDKKETKKEDKKFGYDYVTKEAADDGKISKDQIKEIDITEAYNLITNNDLSEEDKVDIASYITTYRCIGIYKQLSNVTDSVDKSTLAYEILYYGYEKINKILYDFNDKITDDDIYAFMNDVRIGPFLDNIFDNRTEIDKKYMEK